jgi:hypothetical protein
MSLYTLIHTEQQLVVVIDNDGIHNQRLKNPQMAGEEALQVKNSRLGGDIAQKTGLFSGKYLSIKKGSP